jgi:hypothetical protein
MSSDIAQVEAAIQSWLSQVVIAKGLCPFASKPTLEGRVAIEVSVATKPEDLLEDLHRALCRLEESSVAKLETSLLVVPNMLVDFYDYNDFLDVADALLVAGGWEGEIQIASFHPAYQFADTAVDDAENFTNRAPFPVFHLLREDSLEQALADFADPDAIPARNIALFQAMSKAELQTLFPYCFNDQE